MPDRFAHPASFIRGHGIPVRRPSRFGPSQPPQCRQRDTIEEWDAGTSLVWECRGELPRRAVAWYGEWLKGRGTFLATRLLPPWGGWGVIVETDNLPCARELSPDAGLVFEVLVAEGPLPKLELRSITGLDRRAFARALASLRRGLVRHYLRSQHSAAWESSVYEPTARAFRVSPLTDRWGALAVLLDAYRDVSPRPDPERAGRLFGAPAAEVRFLW
ncbi:MAG: AlkZ-related protein [Acidimicrobiia bacterium]